MNNIKTINALGISSSTSFEGVGVAMIKTDGVDVFGFGPVYVVPYDDDVREMIEKVHQLKPDSPENAVNIRKTEIAFTEFCAGLVKEFLADYQEKIDIIGFAGHTIAHDPCNHYTHQIGDGKMLAELTGIKTVSKFRRADIMAGGQGAPFTPIYYGALTAKMRKPMAVVDIGNTSDVVWFGQNGEMMAFVTGPGNPVIDNWVLKKGAMHMDYNGKLAITGKVNQQILDTLMRHKYLAKPPPKACDRSFFNEKMEHLNGLSLEDGAATATAYVAESIVYSMNSYLPEPPLDVIISGGGSKNPTLVRFIRQRLPGLDVKTAQEIGWSLGGIDAQAAAFWAVRRLYFLPISFPFTTGVPEPMIGGELFEI